MATTTTNFGWDIPQSTDLVKDGATAIAALGQDIDTALIDLKGGTSGQILSKASATDLDYAWITNDVGDITAVTAGTGISGGGTSGAVTVTNSMATAIDAKGDLIAGTGADAFSRLAVGTNGYLLTADSAEATGMKWAAAPGGGKILQVVQAVNTATQSTTSTSYVDAITVAITPSSVSSRILVMGYITVGLDAAATQCAFQLRGGATGIFVGDAAGSRNQATGVIPPSASGNYSSMGSVSYVDSPATTASVTYGVQYKVDSGATSTIYLGRSYNDNGAAWSSRVPSAGIICMEIGA
jgi:hypothetical protein